MGLRATLQVLDSDDRRSSDRRDVAGDSTVRAADAVPNDVEVLDLSRSGASFRSATDFPIGTAISFGLAGVGVANATVVRRDRDTYGCAFDRDLSPAQAAIAFGVSSVVQFGDAETPGTPSPRRDRWPAPVRLALLFAGAIASWTIAILLLRSIF